ncbi:CHAT domain-containing protein [Spirulina sp. 06S082]|uniref:CHAT domain-containing protein n=1 Tax=Spirulina sp. 06S082 TaxID=3110248 RepID=UPI002B20D13E|nr:CHAT domain-containing protein [Spirulina sp. 06S082]MEA5467840.1 CHAT domain-containing protein [Spirulina sp. 06S082]
MAQSLDRETIPEDSNLNLLLEQGKKQYEMGQFRAAIATLQAASLSLEKQGKISEQAQSLQYLSWTYQALGQYQEAERAILQSLALLQTQSPSLLLATVRNTLAHLQLIQGQPDRALINWQRAEELYRNNNDKIGELGSQINQAQVLEEQGKYRLACDRLLVAFGAGNWHCKTLDETNFELVLQTIQQNPYPILKGLALRSLGVSLQALGSLHQSQEAIAASLEIFQTLDRPSEIPQSLLVLGNTERFLGETQTALEMYKKAAKMARSQGKIEDLNIAIESLANQFSLLVESDRLEEAENLFREIQVFIPSLSPSETTIYAQLNVIRSWLQLQQKQENPADYTEISHLLASLYQQAKKSDNSRAESQVLGMLGYLYGKTNRLEDAIALTQQAIALSQDVEFLYEWQGQLANFLEIQGQKEAAIATYREAISTFEKLRLDLIGLNPKIRYNFRDRIEPIYRNYIALQLQSQPSQQQLQEVKKAIEGLRITELEDFLQEVCLTHHSPPESETELATIYTMILGDRLEILVSLPHEKLHHYPAQITPAELQELTAQFRQSFSPIFPSQYHRQYAEKLYEKLIQPLENELKNNQISTLAFVLDGTLQNVPMAVLHNGENYLLEEYELVVNPGLQLLAERSPKKLELKAIAAGLSEAREPFTPLPAVAGEVTAIGQQLASEILLNEDFTVANLQKILSDRPFPILHLATHGQFSSHIEDTFLLTWDGPLNLKAFAHLLWERESGKAIPIELLVLSACQTAKGDDRATLGLAGMAVRSGARSTLASLWSVNDESTAQIMVTFYQFLAHFQGDRAKALRQAQISLLHNPNYQHPYYWAPFILVGYWR